VGLSSRACCATFVDDRAIEDVTRRPGGTAPRPVHRDRRPQLVGLFHVWWGGRVLAALALAGMPTLASRLAYIVGGTHAQGHHPIGSKGFCLCGIRWRRRALGRRTRSGRGAGAACPRTPSPPRALALAAGRETRGALG